MLTGLDPHSSYMDAKSFRDMQVQTHGEFGGLGIEVTMEDGLVKVVSPIDDTPAAKAGIRAGDMITAHRRRGGPGPDAQPGGREDARPGQHQDQAARSCARAPTSRSTSPIMRDIIKVRSVRSRNEGDDVGYIRITQFNEQTVDGLKKAISDITASSAPTS